MIFVLVLGFLVFSQTLSADDYIYTPHFPTEYKYMEVDEEGITVAVENRVQFQIQLILYHLDLTDKSLIWQIEDSINARIIDTQITQNSIYVLQKLWGAPNQTILSKFNRKNGELIWRNNLGGQNDVGQFLRVNEKQDLVIVVGENQEISQIWKLNTNGVLQSQHSLDIAISNQDMFSGRETIYQIYLHDDASLVIVAVMELTQNIRLIRFSESSSIIFDHTFTQVQSFVETLNSEISLKVSPENSYLITFGEESAFGVPRFVQYSLDENGELLFVNQSDNFAQRSVIPILSHYKSDGNILNVTDTNIASSIDIEMFHTLNDGQFVPFYDYTYHGHDSGTFSRVQTALISENENLFVIADERNIFPDETTDNIYLQWDSNGNLCSEFVDNGTDYYTFLTNFNDSIYELSYRGEFIPNGRHLRVIKHSTKDDCSSDLIFQSDFEIETKTSN